MLVADKLTDLLGELPEPGRQSEKADKAKADKVLDALRKGGKETIAELVDLLVEPGKGDDVKARYALHALATRAAQQEDAARRQFAEALAATLKKDRPAAVAGFVLRQLQVCGGSEVVGVLGRFLQDKDVCEEAAQALIAIGGNVTPLFHRALVKASGKNLLTIAQALGVLKDKQAVPALVKLTKNEDQEVRIVATWGLANIAITGTSQIVMKAADAKDYERIQGAKSCLLLAENLTANGNKDEARKVYRHLVTTRTDAAEKYVKDAASAGLKAL